MTGSIIKSLLPLNPGVVSQMRVDTGYHVCVFQNVIGIQIVRLRLPLPAYVALVIIQPEISNCNKVEPRAGERDQQ